MRIHGIVYIVVGLFIAILSRMIDSTKLILFIFVGIVMALFGIWRLWRESSKPQTPNSAYTARHTRVTQPLSVKYCIQCGFQLPAHAQFCQRCRARQV